MGLARLGIIDGRKVDLKSILTEESPSQSSTPLIDSFTERALSSFGFLGIARKIVAAEPLTQAEIKQILSRAGMPVLMKLCSLRKREDLKPRVVPAICLPMKLWQGFESDLVEVYPLVRSFLESIPYPEVHVGFDHLEVAEMPGEQRRFLTKLAKCRSGIVLVGPRIEEILRANQVATLGEEKSEQRIEQTLLDLKECGIHRLQSSNYQGALRLTRAVGFSNVITSDLTKFESPSDIADELLRLESLAAKSEGVDVWGPGINVDRQRDANEQIVSDFQLLRVLATGALVLRSVPRIRASSRFFSVEAMGLARFLGANDLGFGAFDRNAIDLLRLKPLAALERVINYN